MFTPSEYQEILADFGRRLDAITAYCEQIGTLPILVIPPANESGFEPNRSVLPESVTQAQRQAITLRYQEARDLEAEDPEQSIALYRSLLETAPELAEAHFRLARLLQRIGPLPRREGITSVRVTSMVSPSAARASSPRLTGTSPRDGTASWWMGLRCCGR